jgi:UDP-N-acetyl-D-glucosamine/UDP-N-acetyl-D-galactosamine dehydrogenase
MGAYVARQVIKLMTQRSGLSKEARVLILGLAFKENCPDLRNTRVVDIVAEFKDYGITCDVHDPWVNPAEARHEYGLEVIGEPLQAAYDAVILAVAHRQFRDLGVKLIRGFGKPDAVLYDVKQVFPKDQVDGRL